MNEQPLKFQHHSEKVLSELPQYSQQFEVIESIKGFTFNSLDRIAVEKPIAGKK